MAKTFIGGSGVDDADRARAIALDSSNNIYLTGTTPGSSNFPTKNAIDTSLNGQRDAFVTKINAAGTAWVYSTYLGGDGGDWARGVAVDPVGNVFITGGTQPSSGLATSGAFDESLELIGGTVATKAPERLSRGFHMPGLFCSFLNR